MSAHNVFGWFELLFRTCPPDKGVIFDTNREHFETRGGGRLPICEFPTVFSVYQTYGAERQEDEEFYENRRPLLEMDCINMVVEKATHVNTVSFVLLKRAAVSKYQFSKEIHLESLPEYEMVLVSYPKTAGLGAYLLNA